MTNQQVLEQDEIDALLEGVSAGAVDVNPNATPGEVRSFDFTRSMRIVRGRMPTLEMINERFGRLLRTTFYTLIKRSVVVSVQTVQIMKFAEYIQTLRLPTSLNLLRISPLRGTALAILDPRLVFLLVDTFFGGKGRHAKIEGREFTSIETEVIRMLLDGSFKNLQEAWAHVIALNIEHLGSEMNPQFANIVSPTEIVVVCRFEIEMDGGGGELHITMPYSMIEPLRDVLDAGVQSDRVEQDDHWSQSLKGELELADINLRAVLGTTRVTVGELAALKAGDVLTTDFDGSVLLMAEDVPVSRGTLGVAHGQQAVRITARVKRATPALADGPFVRASGELP
ncbi:MAG: flagellar motor switch protein FliM [Proteobacteria bacterium]|nr:flagellar motor switch protein FliM [Pseudomonadota bacterium]